MQSEGQTRASIRPADCLVKVLHNETKSKKQTASRMRKIKIFIFPLKIHEHDIGNIIPTLFNLHVDTRKAHRVRVCMRVFVSAEGLVINDT